MEIVIGYLIGILVATPIVAFISRGHNTKYDWQAKVFFILLWPLFVGFLILYFLTLHKFNQRG